jgi:hypothetical protein
MEFVADPVAAVVAHNGVAIGFRVRLDRPADVAEASTRLDHADPAHHALVRDLDQAFYLGLHVAHEECPVGVAVELVEVGGHIDVQNVAIAHEDVLGRDPVADHLVGRGADRLGEPVVVQR